MGPCRCFLVTLSNGLGLIRCALKLKAGVIPDDELQMYNEPTVRAKLYGLLSERVSSFGHIVQVEELIDVSVVGKK